ncbi:MAG: hypothetical protein Q8S73_40085 [Deltaproteobacteria bacterium]|nr:hypothetical protein [Myxococcales bacterium]MDP3220366.1 hypothetical protein [Deltaproteobacteria bacterium]
MSAADTIRRLVSAVPTFEARHAFELAGMLVGVKDVVRIVVDRAERDTAVALLAELGVSVVPSHFALATNRATSLGDRFMVHVDADDPRAESFVLLVAREAGVARRASAVESGGDNEALGSLYGYPPCCVEGYRCIADGEDWVSRLLADHRLREPSPLPSFLANRIGSLFEGAGFLPDYFPCSLHCEGAVRLASGLRGAALACDLADLVAHADAVLRRPIVVWGGLLIQPLDARSEGEMIRFDGAGALRFDWCPERPFAGTFLDQVGAVKAGDRGVTLLDRRGTVLAGGFDATAQIVAFRE